MSGSGGPGSVPGPGHLWSALLAISAARTFAATLLALPVASTDNVDGFAPDVSEDLAEARYSEAPTLVSRVPA